jgi:hypothetical protein
MASFANFFCRAFLVYQRQLDGRLAGGCGRLCRIETPHGRYHTISGTSAARKLLNAEPSLAV